MVMMVCVCVCACAHGIVVHSCLQYQASIIIVVYFFAAHTSAHVLHYTGMFFHIHVDCSVDYHTNCI